MKSVILLATMLGAATGCRTQWTETFGPIEVSNAYLAEPVTPDSPVATYFTVVNRGTEDDELVGISAAFAAQGALHTEVTESGGTRMQPVETVALPAEGRIVAEPGGLHGMLRGITRPPKHSERVTVTLHFRRLGDVDMSFAVVSYADLEERAGRSR